MKHLDDQARYFSLAFLAEIAARGRGIQKELSRKTGISPALTSDLKMGRTVGYHQTRQTLAEAFGYSYAEFIAKGKKLAGEKPENRVLLNSSERIPQYKHYLLKIRTLKQKISIYRRKNSIQAQKLIVMQEKHIAFQDKYIAAQEEIMRLIRENERLRNLRKDSEGLYDPPAGGGRTAPAAITPTF